MSVKRWFSSQWPSGRYWEDCFYIPMQLLYSNLNKPASQPLLRARVTIPVTFCELNLHLLMLCWVDMAQQVKSGGDSHFSWSSGHIPPQLPVLFLLVIGAHVGEDRSYVIRICLMFIRRSTCNLLQVEYEPLDATYRAYTRLVFLPCRQYCPNFDTRILRNVMSEVL